MEISYEIGQEGEIVKTTITSDTIENLLNQRITKQAQLAEVQNELAVLEGAITSYNESQA